MNNVNSKAHLIVVILLLIFGFSIISLNCVDFNHLKFRHGQESVKAYELSNIDGSVKVKILGAYSHVMPKKGFIVEFQITSDSNILHMNIYPENLEVSINNNILKINTRGRFNLVDSTVSNRFAFAREYSIGDLSDEDITYLENTKYPLQITFDRVITINDTAVFTDTVYSTAPQY